jgi:hypothetical protein
MSSKAAICQRSKVKVIGSKRITITFSEWALKSLFMRGKVSRINAITLRAEHTSSRGGTSFPLLSLKDDDNIKSLGM